MEDKYTWEGIRLGGSATLQCLRLHVMHPKPIHKNLLIGFGNEKKAKLDMCATHDGDAHPLPCKKTLSMAETPEINNPAVLIQPEQADSTIGKNMIISEPRESKKGKKVLDHKVVLEKSSDNRESLKITIRSSRLAGQA
jgi:hypothetical protein